MLSFGNSLFPVLEVLMNCPDEFRDSALPMFALVILYLGFWIDMLMIFQVSIVTCLFCSSPMMKVLDLGGSLFSV